MPLLNDRKGNSPILIIIEVPLSLLKRSEEAYLVGMCFGEAC